MDGLRGLDVSHFQGQIDWSAVKGDGYSFAIMKATEGLSFTDHFFDRNWLVSRSVGLIRGAYHFLHPDMDAGEQAKFFARTVGELKAGDLVPWVDVEAVTSDDLWQQIPLVQRRLKVDHFLAECDSLLGVRTGIYTAPGWWNGTFGHDYDHSGRPLWLAKPGSTAPEGHEIPGQWTHVTIWQQSWRGNVAGIAAVDAVDIDCALARLPTVLA